MTDYYRIELKADERIFDYIKDEFKSINHLFTGTNNADKLFSYAVRDSIENYIDLGNLINSKNRMNSQKENENSINERIKKIQDEEIDSIKNRLESLSEGIKNPAVYNSIRNDIKDKETQIASLIDELTMNKENDFADSQKKFGESRTRKIDSFKNISSLVDESKSINYNLFLLTSDDEKEIEMILNQKYNDPKFASLLTSSISYLEKMRVYNLQQTMSFSKQLVESEESGEVDYNTLLNNFKMTKLSHDFEYTYEIFIEKIISFAKFNDKERCHYIEKTDNMIRSYINESIASINENETKEMREDFVNRYIKFRNELQDTGKTNPGGIYNDLLESLYDFNSIYNNISKKDDNEVKMREGISKTTQLLRKKQEEKKGYAM